MDEHLVSQAQRGDRHAFALLVVKSIDRLYSVADRILRDPELARDATQQALLDAWRDLPSLRDPSRWDAWTYRMVVHACYALRRSERRHNAAVRFLRLEHPSEPDASRAIGDHDELERAFRSLSQEHRAVIVLHHYRGLPLTEVAAILGIPAGTARSRLHNALRRLRDSLETHRAPATGEERVS